MKKFLVKAVLFAAGVVLLCSVFTPAVRPKIYQGYEAARADVLQLKPRCVVLGDSHARKLKQKYFSSRGVYNLSYTSDNAIDMLTKLRFMVRQGIPPDTVVLECDWHMFSPYRSTKNNFSRSVLFSDFGSYRRLYGFHPVEYAAYRYVFPAVPMLNLGNAGLLRRKLFPGWSGGSPEPVWHEISPQERVVLAEARLTEQFRGDELDETLMAHFADIVKVCGENGIRIVGVRFPVTTEYRNRLPGAAVASTRRFFETLGITIHDFSELYDDPRHFDDADHMDRKAAKRLTARIERLTVRPEK